MTPIQHTSQRSLWHARRLLVTLVGAVTLGLWLAERHPKEALGMLEAVLHDDNADVQELANELLQELRGAGLEEVSELEDLQKRS